MIIFHVRLWVVITAVINNSYILKHLCASPFAECYTLFLSLLIIMILWGKYRFPHLHMKKLSLGDVTWYIQGPMAIRWWKLKLQNLCSQPLWRTASQCSVFRYGSLRNVGKGKLIPKKGDYTTIYFSIEMKFHIYIYFFFGFQCKKEELILYMCVYSYLILIQFW